MVLEYVCLLLVSVRECLLLYVKRSSSTISLQYGKTDKSVDCGIVEMDKLISDSKIVLDVLMGNRR